MVHISVLFLNRLYLTESAIFVYFVHSLKVLNCSKLIFVCTFTRTINNVDFFADKYSRCLFQVAKNCICEAQNILRILIFACDSKVTVNEFTLKFQH